MPKFEIGNQPCNNFVPEDGYDIMGYTHSCPHCDGERVFCNNCHTDHHSFGWEDCWKLQKETKQDKLI